MGWGEARRENMLLRRRGRGLGSCLFDERINIECV